MGTLARPGGVSTPGRLRRCFAAIILLAVLAAGVSLWATASIHMTVRTIGQDAEPSVALALRMADTLSNMDAAALEDSLTDGGGATGTSAAFRSATFTLADELVEAARNVTYGQAEAVPLRQLAHWAMAYQEAIAEARTLGAGDDWTTVRRIRWASRINRDFAAPEAAELARVNALALERRYAAYRAGSLLLGSAAAGSFALLALVLIAVQVWLARRMRRVLNLPMALATVIVLASGLWFGGAVLVERARLSVAKTDAYDSLLVLFQAKGAASALHAGMSLWVLDADTRAASAASMRATVQEIIGIDPADVGQMAALRDGLRRAMLVDWRGDPAALLAAMPHLGGLLGKAIDNVDFGPLELQPAIESIARLVDAVGVIGDVQAQEMRGDHAAALIRWVGDRPGQGDAVFEALRVALDRTILVNRTQFDKNVRAALHIVLFMPFVSCGALILAVLLSMQGLSQRLQEYR